MVCRIGGLLFYHRGRQRSGGQEASQRSQFETIRCFRRECVGRDSGRDAPLSFSYGEDRTINNRNSNRYETPINDQIRVREVRVVDANGNQLGIMPIQDARRAAEEASLDLVLIAPQAKPPVCRIIDYGKYKYEQVRREKEAKKKQHVVEVKEIRMSPNIDENDMNTKVAAARKFLERGDRVKVTLRFRGREMAHMGASAHILTDFANSLTDVAVVEKAPKVEGRTMSLFLAQKK